MPKFTLKKYNSIKHPTETYLNEGLDKEESLTTHLSKPILYSGFQAHEVQIPRFWGVGRPGVGKKRQLYLTHLRMLYKFLYNQAQIFEIVNWSVA